MLDLAHLWIGSVIISLFVTDPEARVTAIERYRNEYLNAKLCGPNIELEPESAPVLPMSSGHLDWINRLATDTGTGERSSMAERLSDRRLGGSTEIAGRVPRGRTEIRDFRDDETLRVSNHLTPRVKAVSSIRRVQYVRYTAQSSG